MHEWRPPSDEEAGGNEDVTMADDETARAETGAASRYDAGNGTDLRHGLSRFVEGLQIEKTTLLRIDRPSKGGASKKGASSANVPEGVPFVTVYEEKTAVTALAWNPNMHVAGWAAAGMADGLLRVEDIAS